MAATEATFHELRHAGLDEIDPEIARLIGDELERQRGQIELIASENFTWPSVLEAVARCRARGELDWLWDVEITGADGTLHAASTVVIAVRPGRA